MLRDPWVRTLVVVTLTITTLYLVGMLWHLAAEFADIILLFFLAWMLAFVIEPTAAPLHENFKLPRTLAIAITYGVLLLLIVIGGVLLVPPLTAQIVQITVNLPGYADQLNREILGLLAALEARGIHLNIAALVQPDEIVRRAEAAGPPLLANVLGLATGVANLLFQAVIVIMLSFYFALDGRRFADLIVQALPDRYREDGHYFFESVNRAFAGFLRGQLLLALVYALGTGAIMRVADLPYGLLSSVLAGVLMLIPFLGAFLALAMPMTITLLARPDSAVLVFAASIILQQVVFNVIAPRVMSQSVGLHPLLVFFVVLAGARLSGVWGALFGVPIVAVISAMVTFYRANLTARRAIAQRALDQPAAEVEHLPPPSERVEVSQR
ncbi:MAG: AI-2E family transporter [Chloroflexota bacterium]